MTVRACNTTTALLWTVSGTTFRKFRACGAFVWEFSFVRHCISVAHWIAFFLFFFSAPMANWLAKGKTWRLTGCALPSWVDTVVLIVFKQPLTHTNRFRGNGRPLKLLFFLRLKLVCAAVPLVRSVAVSTSLFYSLSTVLLHLRTVIVLDSHDAYGPSVRLLLPEPR